MNADFLFQVFNQAAALGWVILILAPKWKITRMVIRNGVYPLALALVYIIILATNFNPESADFTSLEGVKSLFANDYMVLLGWVHYLAFDLFVGIWIVADSEKLGFRHYSIVPALFLTFMLGPTGFLVYMIMRIIKTRKLSKELH
jgi:hypothetical protein